MWMQGVYKLVKVVSIIDHHTHLSLDTVELIVRNRLCYVRPKTASTQRVLIRHLHRERERERERERRGSQ